MALFVDGSCESIGRDVARGVSAVLAVAGALPDELGLREELASVAAAVARGYFLPDEDALVRRRYVGYLSLRAALLETLGDLAAMAGRGRIQWQQRLPVFTTAFAAACVLMRANRFVIDLAGDKPLLWKKLDEADVVAGIPRKTFTTIYRAATSPANLRRFLAASDFYFANRESIRELAAAKPFDTVMELLAAEEPWIERRRRDALRRLFAYRWFSFWRRHRSAWRQVMFGIFEASGRAISELRQPGVKPGGAPKRITEAMRMEAVAHLRPGDVVVTRHDDALSNLFLPGFWPHTALYLGKGADCEALQIGLPFAAGSHAWFLEARKDGVRFRPIGESLQVDAFLVLRPPLHDEGLAAALKRAMSHAGKPYDFLFDFRTADCLACSEVVYRGFHGIGPVRFHLKEVGGRLCLPTEDLIQQALACGFRIVVAGGIGGGSLEIGAEAAASYKSTRDPLDKEVEVF